MHHQVVFDLAEAGYRQWNGPVFGLVFVMIGVLLVRYRDSLPYSRWPCALNQVMRRFFPWVWLSFAVLWTILVLVGTYFQYRSLLGVLESGRATVVEGRVTDFVPMPYTGHADETFTVNGQRFAYSDFHMSAGFNNTSSHGGPIREDLPVRITHVKGIIVRLEIAE